MDRWAANTLRALGIIFTAGFVLFTSLLLVLLSMCAAQGAPVGVKRPDLAIGYAISAAVVAILGITLIARLARAIFRSADPPQPGLATPSGGSTAAPAPALIPVNLSPRSSSKDIDYLVFAMIAQIALSAAGWFFGQMHFWTAPRAFAPHNWTLLLLAPFVLYHVPYAILIYRLPTKPDRRTLAYALAVPAVLVLQSLLSLTVLSHTYVQHPVGFALLFVPWLLHIVIIVLAYRTIQQTGIRPEPSSLLAAALMTFLYFSLIHAIAPLLYARSWR